MHTTRPFMPPFPGSDREAGALADYLVDLGRSHRPVLGAQDVGVEPAPPAIDDPPVGKEEA
jgi:hypothetical protein